MKRVLIIGGYGNFGSFITKRLAAEDNIQIIIAGRSLDKAQKIAAALNALHQTETIALDINRDLSLPLSEIRPDIVIHTSGPFQAQGYEVAEACIAQGCHYIDLADGRDFVEGSLRLTYRQRKKGCLLSVVPVLCHA